MQQQGQLKVIPISQQPHQNEQEKALQTEQHHEPLSDKEEEEDEEIEYKVDQLLPRQNQKQKLIEQNIKLKTQIYELASQLDEILTKDRNNRRKKYGIGIEEEDERVRDKKLELKKQEIEIMEVKNKIFIVKKELDSVFNNQAVQQKQDELHTLKVELKKLEDEKDGLIKIQKTQVKALKTMKNQKQYKERIDKTHREVQKVKDQTQKLKYRALQARKNEIRHHQVYVKKQQKVREVETKIAINKERENNKSKTQKAPMAITNQMIYQLQEEIKKLQIEKQSGQKVWQDKIRNIDGQLQQKRQEEEKKLLIIREKEKELKLNEIRIKQLRKLVKQNIISENTKKSGDEDMSKYRYRRNIKQMQR